MKYYKKEIPNYSGYLADSNGDIWNKAKKIKLCKHNNGGYLHVGVKRDSDGKRTKCAVHRLIAFAFHGIPSGKANCVDHLNEIKDDNRPENLEWVTPEENQRRANESGKSGKLKLSKEQLSICKDLYESYSINYISKVIGVSASVVKREMIDNGLYDGRRHYASKPTVLSDRDVNTIYALYKTGRFSNAQIADKLGNKVTATMIGQYTMKLPKKRTEYRNENICDMYESGDSVKSLSGLYGIEEATVRGIIRLGGFSIREDDIYLDKGKITDLDKFREMISLGNTIEEITEYFGCGRKAYQTARKKCPNVRFGSRSKLDPKKLYEMNLEMPQWAIAETLGCHQPYINKIISKYKFDNNISEHGNYKHGEYSYKKERGLK